MMNPFDINKIPFPRTPSIIPMAIDNKWLFSNSSYDSLGNILDSDKELNLCIGRVYGLTHDSTLELITYLNSGFKFPLYVYEYEWESLKEGLLISYCDKNVDTNGVYIIGEYQGEYKTLFKNKKLWLKYPGKPGDKWVFYTHNSNYNDSVSFELLDTSADYYIPSCNENNVNPIDFLECYLYKKIHGDTVGYYYFHKNIGSVGYLQYISNTIHRSYILREKHFPNKFIERSF